jgi:hypothetical protein
LKELKIFLIDKGQPVSHVEDASWVHDHAFLTHSFGHLNDLNSKAQEKFQLISELNNYVSAF